jgi:hypothetical protein
MTILYFSHSLTPIGMPSMWKARLGGHGDDFYVICSCRTPSARNRDMLKYLIRLIKKMSDSCPNWWWGLLKINVIARSEATKQSPLNKGIASAKNASQ